MIKQRRRVGAVWPVDQLGPDTPLNRRETIGRALLARLREVNPAAAQEALILAAAFGEDAWLAPDRSEPAGRHGGLSRAQVAARAGLDPDTGPAAVTMWATRGIRRGGHTIRLRPHGDAYDPLEVEDFLRLYHDRAAVPVIADATPPA